MTGMKAFGLRELLSGIKKPINEGHDLEAHDGPLEQLTAFGNNGNESILTA